MGYRTCSYNFGQGVYASVRSGLQACTSYIPGAENAEKHEFDHSFCVVYRCRVLLYAVYCCILLCTTVHGRGAASSSSLCKI